MDNILFTAPDGAIPKTGTQAAKLLSLLREGTEISELKLAELFHSNQRSAIQDLGNDCCLNWLIHPIKNEKGKIKGRKLDPRHLSGCLKLDAEARKERRKQLKEASYKQAKQGRIREPKAKLECSEAVREYFLSLGESANDEHIESKKPTKK